MLIWRNMPFHAQLAGQDASTCWPLHRSSFIHGMWLYHAECLSTYKDHVHCACLHQQMCGLGRAYSRCCVG